MVKMTCFHHFFRTIDGVLSGGGFTDKIRITNMRRRGGQMLVDHLNPRELEGSIEVKKSEEEVFKPAGNRHH